MKNKINLPLHIAQIKPLNPMELPPPTQENKVWSMLSSRGSLDAIHATSLIQIANWQPNN